MSFILTMKIMNLLENLLRNTLTLILIIWQKLLKIINYLSSDVLLPSYTVKMVNSSKALIFPRRMRFIEMLLKPLNKLTMLKLLNNCLNSLLRKKKKNILLLLFTHAMIILDLILHYNMPGASICMSLSCHLLSKWSQKCELVIIKYYFNYLD